MQPKPLTASELVRRLRKLVDTDPSRLRFDTELFEQAAAFIQRTLERSEENPDGI